VDRISSGTDANSVARVRLLTGFNIKRINASGISAAILGRFTDLKGSSMPASLVSRDENMSRRGTSRPNSEV
jgi:hypothetical protein